ncbi:hypothetical protein PLESTB_001161500 [Pleodorina starrii]|uniref:F-box/LRR-repeat protein 15-like leucin rich repeat domain-containing protein n=1 Tax=Pleodorina starrii TaxID=330485 RepID=A0A9W6BSW5_9CHLO|nr:hypothetical protein PLESTB_001161500 [Pleodorina starrii]
MRNLRGVVLDGCKLITNDGLKHLHTGIQTLSLRNCSQVTWAGLHELTNLPNLTILNVAGIKLTAGPAAAAPAAAPAPPAAAPPPPGADAAAAGAAGAPPAANGGPVLFELLQRLESLTLGDHMALSFIADRMVVEELAAVRPARLAHLDLSGCIDLTDWAVHELACAIPSLTSLSLQSCVRLTNASVLELARLPRLRALNLRGCLQLNDAGLAAGLSGLAALEELNLQGCTAITGSCLSELAPCKSLAVLNVSHCGALASLEPLRGLPGLRRLDVSHCPKLSPAGITALTALRHLTEVRASHLRHHAAPPPPPLPTAAPANGAAATTTTTSAADQLASLTSLDQLQSLDLSYMSHQGGFPSGLLDAVAELTRLTRLNLAGCGGPSTGGGQEAGHRCGGERSGLGFLSDLRRLQDLDLGSWQEVDPQELSCLAGATALRRLVVSRLGNRHANACFEGCDCSGSPFSSLYPSPYGSPGGASPPSTGSSPPPPAAAVAAAAVAAPPALTAAAAAAAAAEARAELAARGRACSAAIDAAAAEDRRGSCGGSSSTGSSDACGQLSDASDDVATCSSASASPSSSCATGLSAEVSQRRLSSPKYDKEYDSSSCQPPTARCAPSTAEVAKAAASSVSPLDVLTRQMAAVGISCCCSASARRGCGSCSCASCGGSGGSVAAAVVGVVAAAAAAAAAAASPAATSACGLERALAAVPPVAAPLPCLAEAAEASRLGLGGGLPPLPLSPRPGLDGALGHLTGLTALAEIHLEACNHITDEGVARLARLPRLELLDLGGCNRITGRTLGAFATHGSLQTLLLGNCAALTDAGLTAASTVGSLRVVDVSGCNRLTDAGTVTLGSLRRLARLSLRSNSKCSDVTVAALAELPALQWLCLSLCGITDGALRLLGGAGASRSLTWLDLSHCWRLSRAGVRQLEAERAQLKVIFSGRN